MALNENPEVTDLPPMHYVFIEKVGPFMETARPAWEAFHAARAELDRRMKITGAMALYRVEPEMTYRAGASVAEKPESLPVGFRYERIDGGKFTCFTLTGSYAQLPEASGRIFELAEEMKLEWRDDFCVEHYVNDPRTTPEAELITRVRLPTK